MEETLGIRIRGINPNIVCSLCAGYFIDATTITECLHTFCKSCIVKYLQSSKFCPQCNIKIHETQPLMNLRPDRTMQDIVYKLVPELYENEEKRKQEFCKSRGLVIEKKREDENLPPSLTSVYDNPVGHYYRNDEQLCLCLEKSCYNNHDMQLPMLPKKFVRCSVRTCIMHVKQLLQRKLAVPSSLEDEVSRSKYSSYADYKLRNFQLRTALINKFKKYAENDKILQKICNKMLRYLFMKSKMVDTYKYNDILPVKACHTRSPASRKCQLKPRRTYQKHQPCSLSCCRLKTTNSFHGITLKRLKNLEQLFCESFGVDIYDWDGKITSLKLNGHLIGELLSNCSNAVVHKVLTIEKHLIELAMVVECQSLVSANL